MRAAIERARRVLFDVRAPRVRPGRDEKVLASWNGLMLRAMAEGARAFGDAALRDAAIAAGRFLRERMVVAGRARRSWRDGVARIPGFLEDHAALGLGFLALYQLTFERPWLDAALELNAVCVERFWSDDAGAFFDTAHDAEPLVTRPRDVTDNAIPSGTSLAVELQLHVAELTGDAAARRRAEYVLATLAQPIRRSPLAFGHLLGAADLAVHGAVEVALAGEPGTATFDGLRAAMSDLYLPSLVLVGGHGQTTSGIALLRDRSAEPGRARAFVCRNQACELPTESPDELRAQLRAAAQR